MIVARVARNARRLALAMTVRQPWGTDAHSALRWAFGRFARSGVLPTAMGAVHHSGVPTDLSRADLHAQAAIIHGLAVDAANPLHRAYLTCYYVGPPSWERLPGGGVGWVDRFYTDRSAAVHQVAWWLMGAVGGSGALRIRGYQEIVLQYTLGRPNNERLRDLLRVRRGREAQIRHRAYTALDQLHEHALAGATERLQRANLI